LNVEESDNDGFLKLNKKSRYSFVFDSGKRFRGVGLNVCWDMQTEWKHPFETYFSELEKNNANFTRTWMCPWNLPLEWTRVPNYDTIIDEFNNLDKTFLHTPGILVRSGKTGFTEDDMNRVVLKPNSTETIIYKVNDLRGFKVKLFYKDQLNHEGIKCYYSSDNKSYIPAEPEFSQTVNTSGDWYRVFLSYIPKFPGNTNYLKLAFDNPGTTIHLANIEIQHGEPKDIVDAPGLGRYYEKTASRLDEIMHDAGKKGVYIMLTLDYHGIFKPKLDRWGSNDEWRRNPYNVDNGGPCNSPEDFFTNPEAKKIYKKRLRYLVARWGYSTNLACWEFWNEIDNVMEWQNVPAEAIVSWHREMADYLRGIDPYGHLISTSVSHREMPGLWKIENIDFSQHHEYGPTKNIKNSILKYVEAFNKPDIVGEYALGWKGPGKDYPVELYEGEMHDGMWRGLFSPSPVLPLSWWWEWHYHQGHYFHLKGVAGFVNLLLENDTDNLEDINIENNDTTIETLGLKAGKQIFIWIRNYKKEDISELGLAIPVTGDSAFSVNYYDTWTGEFSEKAEINSTNGKLVLKNTGLKAGKDIAVWLKPV
jgi:hypothetical protein